MNSLRVAALLAAVAALAACGEQDKADAPAPTASASAKAPDACSLMTKADAEAAIGATVTGPQKSSGMGTMDQCQYLYSGERLADQGAVTVQVYPVDIGSQQKAFADAGVKSEPVTGIGESAFWAPSQSALFVGKGAVSVSFSVSRQGIDMKAASRALAEKGLARLP